MEHKTPNNSIKRKRQFFKELEQQQDFEEFRKKK